jgi:hypothetical protein
MQEFLIFVNSQKARKNKHIIKLKTILTYKLWFDIWKRKNYVVIV